MTNEDNDIFLEATAFAESGVEKMAAAEKLTAIQTAEGFFAARKGTRRQ